MTAAAPRM
uniref:Uncharacterized protein n=1 Tax=Arundo donax TaxID=35708 RepID=A0A0A8YUS8_ARUDO